MQQSAKKLLNVTGTHDLIGPVFAKHQHVVNTFRSVVSKYGFDEVRFVS